MEVALLHTTACFVLPCNGNPIASNTDWGHFSFCQLAGVDTRLNERNAGTRIQDKSLGGPNTSADMTGAPPNIFIGTVI
jgi:hypothetical protein